MTNIRFQLDATGIAREELAEVLSHHFSGHCCSEQPDEKMNMTYHFTKSTENTWTLAPAIGIIGQKPNGNGQYVRGGVDYCTRIISPPFSIIQPDVLYEIAVLLEQHGALANKSCRYRLTVDTPNLQPKETSNIVAELASVENYFSKILLTHGDFTPLTMSVLRRCVEENYETVLEFLHGRGTEKGISYRDGLLVLDYCKATISSDKVDYLVAFTYLITHIIKKAVGRKTLCIPKYMEEDNEKFRFRTYIVRLGLGGKKYKTTRALLTQFLTGNSAWLNPDQKTKNKTEKDTTTA